jgi:ABC-2 type transport system permease protein
VPDDVTTLLVKDDPQLTDQELYRIDQFVMRGGRLLALVPGVDVNLGTLSARNRQVKMGPLLGSYGVQVQNKLVVDAQAPMVGFDVGYFLPLTVRYPWFPQVTADGLSRRNPITSDMQSLVLPWTSPLSVTSVDSAGGASVSVDTLALSSRRSFTRAAPYDLNPQSKIVPPDRSEIQPQLLAVALTGKFPTHWPAGTPIPGDSLGTATRGPAVSPVNQMVVVGSSNFLDQRFLRQFPANSVFLANAVDWMTLGNDLIAIRSREAMGRPLKDVPEKKRGTLKTMAMVPVPFLVILFGLVRMRYRRERRKRYALEFGGGHA